MGGQKMNITFLVGNGFDVNLGLKTKYNDFIEMYKDIPAKSIIVHEFKQHIDSNKELWVDAELAFGQYTRNYSGSNAAMKVLACHEDFCTELAEYLQTEEEKFSLIYDEELIKKVTSAALRDLKRGFRTEEAEEIQNFINSVSGGLVYNFITYNYTTTLDKCIDCVKSDVKTLGNKGNNPNKIGVIKHVHGTTEEDMIFGLNDETQIENIEIFKDAEPEILSQIIKIRANKMYRRKTDAIANDLLLNSHIIYIYGMSLGETDKLWWERICTILKNKTTVRVIIYSYETKQFDTKLLGAKLAIAERKVKEKLLSYSNLTDAQKQSVMSRIHITTQDIFAGLSNIVKEE